MDLLWLIVVALGPLLLAILIGYVLLTRRKSGPREREARREAVEHLYEEEPENSARRNR
jgi:hypothetical protein